MRAALVIVAASSVLTACQKDKSAEIFGRSYDECVLLNARTGGDAPSREMAIDICARRFQRNTLTAERGVSIAVERNMRWGVTNYLVGGVEDQLLIMVGNERDDRIITQVSVVADFSDKPAVNGVFPADAKIETQTWTFAVNLAPNNQKRLIGTFQNNRAPTRNVQMDAYALKVVPFAEKR